MDMGMGMDIIVQIQKNKYVILLKEKLFN
jgi:hypothetical protein